MNPNLLSVLERAIAERPLPAREFMPLPMLCMECGTDEHRTAQCPFRLRGAALAELHEKKVSASQQETVLRELH